MAQMITTAWPLNVGDAFSKTTPSGQKVTRTIKAKRRGNIEYDEVRAMPTGKTHTRTKEISHYVFRQWLFDDTIQYVSRGPTE